MSPFNTAQEQLIKLAREAGAAGVSYAELTYGDKFAALVDAAHESSESPDFRPVEAAFVEGRLEHRAKTWRSIWTTAPVDYDQFGTETAEGPFLWNNRQLRRALAEPGMANYQAARYGSGGHGTWDEDPRIAEAKIREGTAREKREREEREQRRAAGLEWLRTVDDAALAPADEDAFDAELHTRCLTWQDAREERRRRADEKQATERAAQWAKCRATFADGATLVDEGSDSSVVVVGGMTFRNQGRDPKIWHNVVVEPHYAIPDSAEDAHVVVRIEGKYRVDRDDAGSLASVADRLAKGELRIAREDEQLPPRAAIARIGPSSWKDILRVEVSGKVAWIGRPQFSWDPITVDDTGRLVRTKALREAAERALRAKTYGGTA